MTYPLVQELAADGLPVAVTCRVLGFSRQGYYKWRACPVTDAQWRQAHLINAAHDIYADDPGSNDAGQRPARGIAAAG